MAVRKRITLHPILDDGNVDLDTNLYPKTFLDGIVDREGNEVEVALKDELSNYVTTDTTQIISGYKTFANDVLIGQFAGGTKALNLYYGSYISFVDPFLKYIIKVKENTDTGMLDIISKNNTLDSDIKTLSLPRKDGTIATISDIPTNYVTTDTIQDITGQKTFTSSPIIKDCQGGLAVEETDGTFLTKYIEYQADGVRILYDPSSQYQTILKFPVVNTSSFIPETRTLATTDDCGTKLYRHELTITGQAYNWFIVSSRSTAYDDNVFKGTDRNAQIDEVNKIISIYRHTVSAYGCHIIISQTGATTYRGYIHFLTISSSTVSDNNVDLGNITNDTVTPL